MKSAEQIITEAIALYNPVKVVLMVSGGHDSITNAHVSARILKRLGLSFVVYHGDTTIGIPETQLYVKEICTMYGWDLVIRRNNNPIEHYDAIVEKFGFPGPTRSAHQLMYRLLKERALRKFVTHECKSSPRSRENVLLLTGVRKQESLIRMGYTAEYSKDASKIWCSPIFYWSESECDDYMVKNSIPRNPVKDKICISGECLCGAFAGKEEWAEIKACYPETAKRIEKLHEKAKANGKPWHWASGPNEWKASQLKKIQPELNFMCVGCEKKYNHE